MFIVSLRLRGVLTSNGVQTAKDENHKITMYGFGFLGKYGGNSQWSRGVYSLKAETEASSK